jgi:hypothetical protein
VSRREKKLKKLPKANVGPDERALFAGVQPGYSSCQRHASDLIIPRSRRLFFAGVPELGAKRRKAHKKKLRIEAIKRNLLIETRSLPPSLAPTPVALPSISLIPFARFFLHPSTFFLFAIALTNVLASAA